MPVIKYQDISPSPINMDGVKDASKSNVIGKTEGWDDHTLRVFRLQPGGYTPRHKHDWPHINFIVSGRGRLRIGETVHDLHEKDFALVPSNIEHQFENPYDDVFEFVCIVPNRGAY